MTADTMQLLIGLALGALAIPLAGLLLRGITIEIEDEEAVLVTSFGKLARTFRHPGLHFYMSKALPWTKHTRVSLRRKRAWAA